MINRLQDYVLAFLQKRCRHEDKNVVADILEGDVGGLQVRYCRYCGAVKIDGIPEDPSRKWRSPEPLF